MFIMLNYIAIIQLLFIFIKSQSIKDQEPNGVHLVYGTDPGSEVNIIWWTKIPISTAIVYYGLLDTENDYIPIEAVTCNHQMTQKGFLARNSTNGKYIQRVRITDLKPSRRYCYEITSGHASSHIFSFRTADLLIKLETQDEHKYHSNFIVYGSDIQPLIQNQNSEHLNNNLTNKFLADFSLDEKTIPGLSILTDSLRNNLIKKKINAFINLPLVHLKEYNNKTKRLLNAYDFLDVYTDVLSNVQVLPSVGQLADKTSLNLFNVMFPLLGKLPFNSYFYSVNVNGIHFISYSADLFTIGQFSDRSTQIRLDSNTIDIIENQIDLIEKDLITANNNRDLNPWIVVIVSQSVDCIDSSCNSVLNDVLKQKLDAMFYEYNVDLILESGSNIYERSYPVVKTIRKYQTDYKNVEMPVVITIPKYSIGINKKITDDWSAFKFQPRDDHTYGIIEIYNSTCIKWTYIYSNESIIDKFILQKNHNDVFERIYKARKHLLDSIEAKLNNNYKNKMSKNQARSSSTHKLVIVMVVLILIAIVSSSFVYFKRHLRIKSTLKLNSNYSNLIESEFDT